MNIFIYILMGLAVVFIGININMLDFDQLLQGDSSFALIGILCGLCAIVALSTLLIARKIAVKKKHRL